MNGVVPNAYLEWRFEKAGFVTASDATAFILGTPSLTLLVTLHTPEETPAGMVHVTAGAQPRPALIAGLNHLPPRRLRDFWIDRFEVTNREFKVFVDAGGYRDRKHWQHAFVDGGRTLSFEQAMARFTDSTGRPGPATWESGNFLEGQEDLPVRGVSWYEAAALLAWSGKSLPTIFHWSRAADQRMSGVVAPRSNFHGQGAIKVGASGRLNRWNGRPRRQIRNGARTARTTPSALHQAAAGTACLPVQRSRAPAVRTRRQLRLRGVKCSDGDGGDHRRTGGVRGARFPRRAAVSDDVSPPIARSTKRLGRSGGARRLLR